MANKVGGPGGRSTWVGRLESQRAPARANAKPGQVRDKDAMGGPARAAVADDLGARLVAAAVPEKLANAQAEVLRGALPEIVALAGLGEGIEPWRKKQLDRALGQIYKVLGLQLSLVPEADRPKVAKGTLSAYLELAKKTGVNDHLMPVIFAAAGLVDSGARLVAQKKLKETPDEAANAAKNAATAVEALATTLTGRSGAAAALNVFPNLVEQLERAPAQITPKERALLWREVLALVDGAVPRRGFDQAAGAHLAELVTKALADGQRAKDVPAAVLEIIRAESAPLFDQARQQLAVEPHNLAQGTPGRQCYDHVYDALRAVLDASPNGSDALYGAIEAFRALAAQRLQNAYPQALQGWGCAAAIVKKLADAPAAPELLHQLSQLVPSAIDRPQALAALQRAVDAPDLQGTIVALFEAKIATWNCTFAHYPNLEPAVRALVELPAGQAAALFCAAAPQLANANLAGALVGGLVELAKTTRPDDPVTYFTQYAARYGAYANRISAYLGAGDVAWQIAARFAAATTGPAPAGQPIEIAGAMLRAVKNGMARVDLFNVLGRDAEGRPGIIDVADPAVRYRHAPTNYLEQLTGMIRAGYQHFDADKQTEAVRVALALTVKLGQLDGDPQLPFQRIQADYAAAFNNPANLRFAARPQQGAALRAQQPTVAAFLDAHPELPLELAFTAGVYLQPDQLAWLCDRVGAAHGRDTVRALRDFVFACVTANKLDVLDTLRASASPAKAISAVITHVAREYRGGKVNELPWDRIKGALVAGGDPIAEIQAEKVAAGMRELEAMGIAGDAATPAGMEVLARCAPAITSCIKYYEEQKLSKNTDGQIDYAPVLEAFQGALRSVADGTWPKVKYENEVGRRLLGILSPEQEKIWREEMLTPLAGAGDAGDAAETRAALQLLRGLVKALPEEVKLTKASLEHLGELRFDRATAVKLAAFRDTLLEELHETEKGTPRHRELGNRLGAVNRNLAVIELQLALAERFAGGAGSRDALVELKPLLERAAPALRALGAKGSHAAVGEVLFAAADVKTSARPTRYAVDEDALESLIMSHTQASGSCLNYVSGFRRWGLAGSAADANIRMLRSYDGDKFGYRAFLKLFPVAFEGYEGPALWIDTPLREGNGAAEDLQLLYRTAIRKAAAMGIPVLGPQAQLTEEGKKLGQETQAKQVTFSIDEGNTGAQHSDYLFGGVGNVRAKRGQEPFWKVAKQAQIVMPPPK